MIRTTRAIAAGSLLVVSATIPCLANNARAPVPAPKQGVLLAAWQDGRAGAFFKIGLLDSIAIHSDSAAAKRVADSCEAFRDRETHGMLSEAKAFARSAGIPDSLIPAAAEMAVRCACNADLALARMCPWAKPIGPADAMAMLTQYLVEEKLEPWRPGSNADEGRTHRSYEIYEGWRVEVARANPESWDDERRLRFWEQNSVCGLTASNFMRDATRERANGNLEAARVYEGRAAQYLAIYVVMASACDALIETPGLAKAIFEGRE